MKKAMKRIDIITLFPEMLQSIFSYGVLSQGLKNNILEIHCHNPREMSTDKHRTVDDRPYGGGEGMVLMAEPLSKTFKNIPKENNSRFIYLSPQGRKLDSQKSQELAAYDQLIFLCGRYEGVDERFVSLYVDEELSIGDFVVSGGELPCAIAIDSISRFYEGLLGNKGSFENDTFQEMLVKYPQFTRPPEFEGLKVPEVLMSGNHKLIEGFRKNLSVLRTHFKRPDIMFLRSEDPKYSASTLKELDSALELYEKLSPEERKTLGLPDISTKDH
jgi:tRNA (guanine37-N1)-methyltransferase